MCVISDFRRDVDKIYTLLNMGPISCPEKSLWNYHCTLRNIPEERRSQQC